LAAWNGHEAVVKVLLEKNANVETISVSGRTPLSLAALDGHEAVVKVLLEKNANIEIKDTDGRTPLSLAAWNGHEAVVKVLLDKNANIETKDTKDTNIYTKALLMATKSGIDNGKYDNERQVEPDRFDWAEQRLRPVWERVEWAEFIQWDDLTLAADWHWWQRLHIWLAWRQTRWFARFLHRRIRPYARDKWVYRNDWQFLERLRRNQTLSDLTSNNNASSALCDSCRTIDLNSTLSSACSRSLNNGRIEETGGCVLCRILSTVSNENKMDEMDMPLLEARSFIRVCAMPSMYHCSVEDIGTDN
jgi:ankyrin repeat protein